MLIAGLGLGLKFFGLRLAIVLFTLIASTISCAKEK